MVAHCAPGGGVSLMACLLCHAVHTPLVVDQCTCCCDMCACVCVCLCVCVCA